MEGDEQITSGGAEYDEFDLDDDFEQIQEEGADDAAAATAVAAQNKLRKLFEFHPECQIDYIESILPKITIHSGDSRQNNAAGAVGAAPATVALDQNHKTYPFLTVYEKTAIIGLRSEVLSRGGQPFIPVPNYITDVREIARMELEQKRLPYIVKRPLPNGTYEYWRLADLMII